MTPNFDSARGEYLGRWNRFLLATSWSHMTSRSLPRMVSPPQRSRSRSRSPNRHDGSDDDYEPYVPVHQRRQARLARLARTGSSGRHGAPTRQVNVDDDEDEETRRREQARKERTLLLEAQEVHTRKAAESEHGKSPVRQL